MDEKKTYPKKRAVNLLKSPMALGRGDAPLMRSPMALVPSRGVPDPPADQGRFADILRSPMAIPGGTSRVAPKAPAQSLDGEATFVEVQTAPPASKRYALRQDVAVPNEPPSD